MNTQALLDALLAEGASLLNDPPLRQYTSPGRPPHDCRQLVVYSPTTVPSIRLPDANRGRLLKHSQSVVGLCIELVECVPLNDGTGNPPSRADLDASGQDIAAKKDALYLGLLEGLVSGDLFDGCRVASYEGVTVSEPSGGFIGLRACMSVTDG